MPNLKWPKEYVLLNFTQNPLMDEKAAICATLTQ